MASVKEIEKAGKQDGLEIWRIENMEMVPVPADQYGSFYTGDSYILLRTKTTNDSCNWDLHFWLGKETSKGAAVAAAILASKIDDNLGDVPVQYREIQNEESIVFRGYFKKGITYKKGRLSSTTKHARTNVSDVKRLLHVKGRRSVRATEVEMSWKSFNQGDIFIVEVENDIYQWNGSKSNRYERLKACELVNSMKNEKRSGKVKIVVIDEGDDIPTQMKEALSGSPADVGPEICDETSSDTHPADLYHVSSDTGSLIVNKIASAPFKQSDLISGDCFILDNGSSGVIYVWKGKHASRDGRSGAMENAVRFVSDRGYSATTKIQVMAEGTESVPFTQFFKYWIKKEQSVGIAKSYSYNKAATIDKSKFDVKALYKTPKFAAHHGMVDDGSGKVEVQRVEGNKLSPVKREDYGKFFAGDCYVILYTYTPKSREEYIIYYWQGQDATKDEVVGSAFFSSQLGEKYGKRPVQCRVVQGKEPKHMLSIFGGHPIIITSGGYSKAAGKDVGVTEKALYQVRSTTAGGTKLIQVETSASALNSNDAFLLKDKAKGLIWIGLGANQAELEAASYGAGVLGVAQTTNVKEGQESDEFWSLLGGKKDYASSPRMQEDLDANPPKLFAISNAKGRVTIEEIPGEFVQNDLEPDDVMMLDAWDQVFIWIGNGANAVERKEAPELVKEYVAKDPRGRDPNCSVMRVNMGSEPVTFTGFFPSWDHKFFEVSRKSYVDRMKSLYV